MDYSIRSEFNDNYRYAHDYWSPYTENARVYTLAASGYTWSEAERRELEKEGREPLEFNIMRRPLQFYSGYLRDNLNSIVITPFEGSDQKTADQLDKVSSHVWYQGKGYNKFLNASDECLKSGISLCGLYMDYRDDFTNGDISFFMRPYNSFYLDPTFENIDMSDCSFAIMRDLVSREAAKELLPFVDPNEIDMIRTGFRDDKFINYYPYFTKFAQNRDLLAYDQYYKRRTRKREFLVDEKTGYSRDITDLSPEDKQKLKYGSKRLKNLYEDANELGLDRDFMPSVKFKTVDREYISLYVMLNGEPVYEGVDKTGIDKTYPFVPLLCYFEPSIWDARLRIQGIASTQYSIQRQFNKRHMKINDIMDSSISTGYKYLIGSVPDPHDLQQAGQNKIIGVDPENAPEGLNSVQELTGGNNANPALMEYQRILDQLSLTLANVNESVLGIDEGGNSQVSGRLAQVRVAQGLRTNRKVFDNIEEAQLILGGLVLDAIQKNYDADKVERILGEEPTEQFYEQEFERFDANIKQGIRSQSQKDAYYYELVNLKREGIVDVPQMSIVKALPIAGLSDLEEDLQQHQQELQQQQEKINAQEVMAMQLGNAQKEQMIALAQERRARVVSDLALSQERASEAEQNRAQAALDRAKTITEIAKMEDERLIRVMEFVKQLEDQEMIDREYVKEDILNQADTINEETEGSAENKQKELIDSLLQGTPPVGGMQ